MRLLVEVLLGVLLAGAATTGSVALTMRSRLRRSVRLVPDRHIDVPWRWRWSLRRAPVLHRRLQRCCQVVLASTGGAAAYRVRAASRWGRRSAERETTVLQTTGRALLDQATAIDVRLVAADRGGPAWRRLHLPALTSDIAALEASCLRLAQLARSFDDHLELVTARGTSSPQTDLLLDAMEAALADLRRAELAAGT